MDITIKSIPDGIKEKIFKQVEEELRKFDEEHGEEQDRQMAKSQRQEDGTR